MPGESVNSSADNRSCLRQKTYYSGTGGAFWGSLLLSAQSQSGCLCCVVVVAALTRWSLSHSNSVVQPGRTFMTFVECLEQGGERLAAPDTLDRGGGVGGGSSHRRDSSRGLCSNMRLSYQKC